MGFSWLASDRAKNVAALLSAAAAVGAVVVSATRPSAESMSKAYELLKEEMRSQRAELTEVHQSLIETSAWIKAWKEYTTQREHELVEARVAAEVSTTQPTKRSTNASQKKHPHVPSFLETAMSQEVEEQVTSSPPALKEVVVVAQVQAVSLVDSGPLDSQAGVGQLSTSAQDASAPDSAGTTSPPVPDPPPVPPVPPPKPALPSGDSLF